MLNTLAGIIAGSTTVAPAPTSPVAGYKAWYDASDTGTITVSGSNVTQWNDKSANGLNLVQGTAAKQPLSGTRTQNGKNMIDYDGNNDVLSSNAAASAWKFLTDATGSTVFVAMFCDTSSADRTMFDVSNGSVANVASYTWAINTNDTGYLGKGTDNPSGYNWFVSGTNQTFSDNAAQCWTLVSDPTNGTAANRLKVYKNTTLDSATNTQTGTSSTSNPAQPLNVGGYVNFAYSFDGGICEILIYDSILNSTDIATNQSYLAAKWGI
jgi:hypothetical protein